jgi:thymidylate synthase
MSVFGELLWFLSGSTSNEDLEKLGCKFWRPWVDDNFTTKNGFAPNTLGPVYGFQLRHFGGYYGNGIGGKAATESDYSLSNFYDLQTGEITEVVKHNSYGSGGFDQLKWVVNRIKEDYSCRRTLWSLWNPQDVGKMRLPPCHMMAQILVDDERRLSLIMYQRSGDEPLGIPANVLFYSTLAVMIAQQTDCIPYEFIHMVGDAHIYEDQIEAVEKYLALPQTESPKLEIKKAKDIFSYCPEDFIVTEFNPGPRIEIPVAV